VVAADRRDIDVDENIGDPIGLERSGNQIAQIEDAVDLMPRNIVEHRLEREAVAVNIGDDRDLHLAGEVLPGFMAATSAFNAASSLLCA
jgi:hypothetical protein